MSFEQILEGVKLIVLLVWSYDGVKFIVGHTVVNLVAAVAGALKAGEFELGKVGEFLYKKLLPYVSVYFILKAFGDAAELTFLAPIAWAAIETTLLGDLMDSVAKLGLAWPEPVARLVVKR